MTALGFRFEEKESRLKRESPRESGERGCGKGKKQFDEEKRRGCRAFVHDGLDAFFNA